MSAAADKQTTKVAVIGGGLVGALQACFLGKRGFEVHLFEMRQDIRDTEVVKGRSINLALSERGRAALRHVGLEELVVAQGVPMPKRMIHDRDGTLRPIPYGQDQKRHFILSVDRRKLNEVLLTEAERYANVSVFFEHKFKSINKDLTDITFESPSGQITMADYSGIFCCDGAYSALRRHLMCTELLDFSQTYIKHGYLELNMPPDDKGKHRMDENSLHIWAREGFMMIGLPNQGGSYTMTVFMPFENFSKLRDEKSLMTFFEENFADAIPLLGKEEIEKTLKLREQRMIMIKCNPHHARGKLVLMGDAAHAMVPFYGQGMNCGFEDCLVMKDALDKHNNDIAAAFETYSSNRVEDSHAICDLAMYNYVVMRSSVNSKLFLLRTKIDNLLYRLFPYSWVPLYNMVSFTRTPYSLCITNRAWQDRVLNGVIRISAVSALAFGVWSFFRHAPTIATRVEALGESLLNAYSKFNVSH